MSFLFFLILWDVLFDGEVNRYYTQKIYPALRTLFSCDKSEPEKEPVKPPDSKL